VTVAETFVAKIISQEHLNLLDEIVDFLALPGKQNALRLVLFAVMLPTPNNTKFNDESFDGELRRIFKKVMSFRSYERTLTTDEKRHSTRFIYRFMYNHHNSTRPLLPAILAITACHFYETKKGFEKEKFPGKLLLENSEKSTSVLAHVSKIMERRLGLKVEEKDEESGGNYDLSEKEMANADGLISLLDYATRNERSKNDLMDRIFPHISNQNRDIVSCKSYFSIYRYSFNKNMIVKSYMTINSPACFGKDETKSVTFTQLYRIDKSQDKRIVQGNGMSFNQYLYFLGPTYYEGRKRSGLAPTGLKAICLASNNFDKNDSVISAIYLTTGEAFEPLVGRAAVIHLGFDNKIEGDIENSLLQELPLEEFSRDISATYEIMPNKSNTPSQIEAKALKIMRNVDLTSHEENTFINAEGDRILSTIGNVALKMG
jgi:hypothetical protein